VLERVGRDRTRCAESAFTCVSTAAPTVTSTTTSRFCSSGIQVSYCCNGSSSLCARYFVARKVASRLTSWIVQFTGDAFKDRTGLECLSLSFEDIASEGLPGDELFGIIFVSFALHLVPDASGLFGLLWSLSSRARFLVVIGPHKKPEIKDGWGWTRWDPTTWQAVAGSGSLRDTVLERQALRAIKSTLLCLFRYFRVHLRVYRSLNVE